VAVATQAREVGEGAHYGTTRHTGPSGRSPSEPFEATLLEGDGWGDWSELATRLADLGRVVSMSMALLLPPTPRQDGTSIGLGRPLFRPADANATQK
jgi:hypothetical protein